MSPLRRAAIVVDPDPLVRGLEAPLHRDAQMEEIRTCFMPASPELPRLHAWIHGPPGSGKTFCVRHVLATHCARAGLKPLYVNCRENFTLLSVIEAALDELRPLRPPRRTREQLVAQLRAALQETRTILALDDLDGLPARDIADLLHILTGLPETSLLCIAPSRLPLLALPEAVRSRLAPRQVLMPRYAPHELQEIVRRLASKALGEASLAPRALHRIQELALGDARRALALLRHAVARAESAKASGILPEHFRSEDCNHLHPQTENHLAALGSHHRLLRGLVVEASSLAARELERLYHKACRSRGMTPVATRTLRKYLEELVRKGLLWRERGAGTPGWIYRVSAECR